MRSPDWFEFLAKEWQRLDKENDQLNTDNQKLVKERDGLDTSVKALTKEKTALTAAKADLEKEKAATGAAVDAALAELKQGNFLKEGADKNEQLVAGAQKAVLSAQSVYFDYWAAKGIDVTPFFAVLDGPRIPSPGGAGFAAGQVALQSYFDEMFLCRGDVATTLRQAQAAANAAARR